jgi:hypothetical protein
VEISEARQRVQERGSASRLHGDGGWPRRLEPTCRQPQDLLRP